MAYNDKVVFKDTIGVVFAREFMKVGDRVRVVESVVVYHHPEHKSEPFDVKGLEGEVKAIVTEWRGRPVSANLPVLVEFSKKFKAHFRDFELETVEKEG